MALVINFSEEKMFMQGDFDMNLVQINTDSLKEAFKQTMLNQEVIFRKQVQELHRLYGVQITLLKDLGCNDFGRFNSWKENTQSSLVPHTNTIRYEPQQKEPRLSSKISMVGLAPPISKELLEGCQGTHYKLQEMPFDLQVPANQHISSVHNNFPDKNNASRHFKNTLESHVNNASDGMDLTLSLSIAAKSRRKGAKRSWYDKEIQSQLKFVIDLEDSTERTSRENSKQEPSLGCSGLITYIEGKDESQVSVLSNLAIPRSVKKDRSHEIAMSSFLVDDGECCQERHSSNQETKEPGAGIPCKYMSIKKQQKQTSYDVKNLDLNKVQLDELYCNRSDLMVAYPSAASSIGGLPEMVGRDKLSGTDETELSPAGGRSISRLPINLGEYHASCCSDLDNRDKLTSEIHGGFLNDLDHTFVATRQVSCEKSEKSEVEDTEYPYSGQSQDKRGNEFAASCKSCCIIGNVSSSIKTLQSGIESGNLSIPAEDHVQSQALDILLGEQDQESCGNREHGCIKKKEESAEVDDLIQRAAESLIHISLENSACFHDSTTRSGSNDIEDEETEQPQKSSNSFELITLKLREISSDDYCVSSKPLEVNDADKRDFGIKLRRGRRLKDFQKDILPSLASLSRHEICEDINILEGVLRSKEYRKNRPRMADGESWCLPSRSRRKRLNYLQRRNFS